MDRKAKGKLGEKLSEHYLRQHSFHILKKNYRIQGEIEIDLLCLKNNKIYIIEAKNQTYEGSGFEKLISKEQVHRLLKAEHMLQKQSPYFKVITLVMHWQSPYKKPQIYHLKDFL